MHEVGVRLLPWLQDCLFAERPVCAVHANLTSKTTHRAAREARPTSTKMTCLRYEQSAETGR
jgi:hypothetical protein